MKVFLYIFLSPFYLMYLFFWKLPVLMYRTIKINQIAGRKFRIYVAGAQYRNDDGTDRQAAIRKCRPGEELFLVKTPSKYDEYGILIYRENGECLGWIPAKYSYEFTSEMERGISIRVFFHSKINPDKEFDYHGGRVTIVKS